MHGVWASDWGMLLCQTSEKREGEPQPLEPWLLEALDVPRPAWSVNWRFLPEAFSKNTGNYFGGGYSKFCRPKSRKITSATPIKCYDFGLGGVASTRFSRRLVFMGVRLGLQALFSRKELSILLLLAIASESASNPKRCCQLHAGVRQCRHFSQRVHDTWN